MKAIRIISMMMLFSLTASAQEKKEINWLEELKSRITINGYMQGGYEYSDKGGQTTSTFNFKRAIFWGRARITDRWSFMFMNNFALSKGVLEFWTDYRVTNDKALTVRIGQFPHHARARRHHLTGCYQSGQWQRAVAWSQLRS